MNISFPTTTAAGESARHRMLPHGVTLAWIAAITLWELSGADRRVMQHLADSHGFLLRGEWLLRVLLHDDLRMLSQLAFGLLAFLVWKPFGFLREIPLLERIGMLVGVAVCLMTVSTIKYFSLTSCPWDLAQFGGVAQYVSHWDWGLSDGGAGHCFPSGHASAGYAFLGLALPFLFAGSVQARQRGWRIFAAVFLFGLVCGIAQVLRGAHYPSHVLWTSLICWLVAVINHRIFEYAGKISPWPDGPAAPG